jgi:hypothetical protein
MHRVPFFLLMLCILSPITTAAQELQAVVREFSGKVEVKQPGQDWQPVELNMVISKGATVSTGFASRLLLALGQTEISVRPLTRMVLRELIKQESTNTTSLVLRVGKVNAKVKAATGEKNDFTIRGPASTAAVRGTEFDYDVNVDDRTTVHEGFVSVAAGLTGHPWTLFPGEILDTNGVTANYVRPSVNPPQNDLLTSALQNEGNLGQGGFNAWLGLNHLPTSHSASSNVTITVN